MPAYLYTAYNQCARTYRSDAIVSARSMILSRTDHIEPTTSLTQAVVLTTSQRHKQISMYDVSS